MKENPEMKKICWRGPSGKTKFCVAGFVLEENKEEVLIASTRSWNGFLDEIEIEKKYITSSVDLEIIRRNLRI